MVNVKPHVVTAPDELPDADRTDYAEAAANPASVPQVEQE